MSVIFQNLAQMQNRYPYNQWQEIRGNCDVQLFLGCTDEVTAPVRLLSGAAVGANGLTHGVYPTIL